jgi:hypothetical protein
MKQLNEQQLQTHVLIVGWLLIARSVVEMVGGLIAFVLFIAPVPFLAYPGPVIHDPEAVLVFPILTSLLVLMAGLISALVFGLAIPGLIAGIGLLARKRWARLLGVIVSALGLLDFPVGTLVGFYSICVLMQDAAGEYFEQTAHPRPALNPVPGAAS